MKSENEDQDLDRPIWGAQAIAEEIDRSPRQTFHMLNTGQLPASKIGDRWVTTRRRLRALFAGEAA